MKNKSALICFFFSTAALTVLRICQLIYAIDGKTGFYKNEYSGFSLLCTAAMVISAAAVTLFSFFDTASTESGQVSRETDTAGRSASVLLTELFSLLVGASLAIHAVGLLEEGTELIGTVRLAFLLAAAVGYGAFGLLEMLGRARPALLTLFFTPVWIFELISGFVKYNDVSAVPERTYDILTLCLCTVFSLMYAKRINGFDSSRPRAIYTAVGLCTAEACLISTLPRFAVMLLGKTELLHESAVSGYVLLIFGFFSLLSIISDSRLNSAKKDS